MRKKALNKEKRKNVNRLISITFTRTCSTYSKKLLFIKETKSATMNIFRIFYFVFKSFVKVELSYVFTINLFTIAENCTEK